MLSPDLASRHVTMPPSLNMKNRLPTPIGPGHRLGYKYEPMATDDFYFVDYSVPPDLFVKGVNQIGFQSLDGEDAHCHAPPPGSMTVREVALMVR